MISVVIKNVDGSLLELQQKDSFYHRLVSLRDSGVRGKSLIHALISDDFAAPPRGVSVSGKLEDGTVIDESIPYR